MVRRVQVLLLLGKNILVHHARVRLTMGVMEGVGVAVTVAVEV
jgi:hypothetical protein